jgi:hypothetical protein
MISPVICTQRRETGTQLFLSMLALDATADGIRSDAVSHYST